MGYSLWVLTVSSNHVEFLNVNDVNLCMFKGFQVLNVDNAQVDLCLLLMEIVLHHRHVQLVSFMMLMHVLHVQL